MNIEEEKRAQRAFRARLAISGTFMANGFILSSWVSRIPGITDKLDMSNGETGTALMSIALGSMAIFPFAGKLVGRYSSATVTPLSGCILALALPFTALAPNIYVLILALLVAGIGNGGTEVAMNSQGVEVERLARTNIMNSLHGFYSLGAFIGAGIGAGAAALDIEPLIHFSVMTLICLAIYITGRRFLVPDATDSAPDDAPTFALPPRSLWLLGLVGISAAVGEGAVADWSGLYLNDDLGTSAGFAALGFASFQLAMLIGRFTGDRIVAGIGAVRVLRYGGLLAAAGLAMGVVLHVPLAALIAFLLAGLGLAVGFPLVMSAAGNRKDLPRGQSVAGISTLAYSGFLAGPPMLGWFAEATSLRAMFVIVTLLCFVVVIFAQAAEGAGAIEDEQAIPAASQSPAPPATPLPGD
jgi:fucose permease